MVIINIMMCSFAHIPFVEFVVEKSCAQNANSFKSIRLLVSGNNFL